MEMYKIVAIVLGTVAGTTCHAYPFKLTNTKPDTPLYVNYKVEGSDWKGWKTCTRDKIEIHFRETISILVAANEFTVNNDSIEQHLQKNKAHFMRFIIDPEDPDKTYIINAYYSPTEGIVMQPTLSEGKEIEDNITSTSLQAAISAGKGMYTE